MQNKKHQKKQSTKIVNYLLQKYPITVAMALIINNLLAVGAGLFTQYMLETQINLHPVVASSVSLVVVTFLLVLFGDFFPKNFVRYHSIKFGIKTSYLTLLL